MTTKLLIEIESPIFQTTQPQEAQAHADETGGTVYTWKTTGEANWLERGFAKSDTLALVILPRQLPDAIPMPDDDPDDPNEDQSEEDNE